MRRGPYASALGYLLRSEVQATLSDLSPKGASQPPTRGQQVVDSHVDKATLDLVAQGNPAAARVSSAKISKGQTRAVVFNEWLVKD